MSLPSPGGSPGQGKQTKGRRRTPHSSVRRQETAKGSMWRHGCSLPGLPSPDGSPGRGKQVTPHSSVRRRETIKGSMSAASLALL